MFTEINNIEQRHNISFLYNQEEMFPKVMAKPQQGIPFESHIELLKVIVHYVQIMFITTLRNREG